MDNVSMPPVTGKSLSHESAVKHVTGTAQYVDDLDEPRGLLHVATGQSDVAHGTITKLDLSHVRSAEGVVDVITYTDVPGDPDISPVYTGDLIFADKEVTYVGQPLFAVAATSMKAATRACRLAEIEIEEKPGILTPQQAIMAGAFVLPTRTFEIGDAATAIDDAPHQLTAEQYVRGQEHFYLEGQVSLVTPTEDGGMHVISSSQHPSEVQKLVASVLGVDINRVQTEVRRMGGGFGGKESQAAALACTAAVFAARTGRAVKYRMSRRDDMVQTGKRHDFWNRYRAGFDDEGQLKGVEMSLSGLCGCTADLSEGIVDRAMFHADNAYFYPNSQINGFRCMTHTVSNTAFRGFGGPQGMMAAEALMDDVARTLGKDPFDVRLTNLYAPGRDITPYGQKVEQHMLKEMMEQLADDVSYRQRRDEITEFNKQNDTLRKGLALTPVKFGISFTSTHLNQAGALLHVYTDGSIHINHGGTEMGQGLYTKIAQIVADRLGVSLDRVLVTSTRTDKVPNTSPTAASSGTDLNGMAAKIAADKIRERLAAHVAAEQGIDVSAISFSDDKVMAGDKVLSFDKVVNSAYMNRVQLSATGFYKTPKIEWDKEKGEGQPFFYFANGAACSEVVVDGLTGEYRVTRVDVLHDVGNSINPAIDIGQIEGGFVQGMGWLTTEELLWDDRGRVISNGPANYKIPTAYDVPEHFEVKLYDRENQEDTIYRSKAVGEPPLMLAISVWCALRDAAASFCHYQMNPPMNAPATAEEVFNAIQAAKQAGGENP